MDIPKYQMANVANSSGSDPCAYACGGGGGYVHAMACATVSCLCFFECLYTYLCTCTCMCVCICVCTYLSKYLHNTVHWHNLHEDSDRIKAHTHPFKPIVLYKFNPSPK